MLLPAAGWSRETQRRDRHPMKKKMEKLGLTSQQEAQLKELHTQTAPVRKERMGKIKELRGEIKQELLKDKPSRTALDNYAAQMGNLHKLQNEESIKHLLKVKEILTPEQFVKFTDKGLMDGPGARTHNNKSDGFHKKCDSEKHRAHKQKCADCDKDGACCKKKGN
jgi:Spy/CpxP family protein refolding chaperone